MKKKLVGLLCVVIGLMCTCSVLARDVKALEDSISVGVVERNDGENILFPLRDIFSRAGYDVSWDGVARGIRVTKDFKSAVYTVDKDSIIVDNKKEHIDVAPKIIDDKTYVSMDALEKVLGNRIEWNKKIGIVTIKKDNYLKGNWFEILPLEKTYQSKDDNGKVLGSINVKVPQLENLMKKESIEKINEYYKREMNLVFDEYEKLLPSDIVSQMGKEVEYNTNYIVTYNSNDMLSIVMINKNKKSTSVKYDVFDVNTGDKVELYDIVKIDKTAVDKFKMDAMKGHIGENKNIDADDIKFFIDDGDLVLVANKGIDVLEHRINSVSNKHLFRKNLQNVFNYNEELLAKKAAFRCCRQEFRFIDKTIVGGRECYVFAGYSTDEDTILAVDRYREVLYGLAKQDGAYIVLSEDRINRLLCDERMAILFGDDKIDTISDREILSMVRNKLNNNGYIYELSGNMIDDRNGQLYSIVKVKDIDGQVNKKIAVNRIDRSLYVEKDRGLTKLNANADGTVNAVGCFEIDNNLTDVSEWGQIYLGAGSKMMIGENGKGFYYIADAGDGEKIEYFSLVNEDGKTYIEITNEDGEGNLKRGTRFLVEVKEIDNSKYLYVHDEGNNDVKRGNKYWRLVAEDYSKFEPIDKVM